MKTLILGASTNPERYAHKATLRLLAQNYEVVLVGKQAGEVMGNHINTERTESIGVHTITLYMNPTHQRDWYAYILDTKPARLIFNPGTENTELAELASEQGIQTLEACTLVLLATGQY